MNAIAPLQRWKRDDWIIPCTLRDNAGVAVDLTGCTIVGELWLAGYRVFQPLTVANGGIARVSDAAGQFTVIVSRLLTSQAQGDAGLPVAGERTRVLIAKIDTLGRRQTLGIVPFVVFDGSEALAIDAIPEVVLVSQNASFTIVVAASQGAAGPSEIPAAQIRDGGDLGRQLLQAADPAAARRLLSLAATKRTRISDTNYAVKLDDTYVGFDAITAPRTVTLPLASQYPAGQPLWICDESGSCSTDAPIITAAAGDDTIGNQPNFSMASPFQKAALHSNGTNLWIV